MRCQAFAIFLTACASGGQGPTAEPPSAAPDPAPSETTTPDTPSSTDVPAAKAPSHLCPGRSEPEPCKNDVMRQGGFQEVPACLRVLPPMVTGSANGDAFEGAFASQSDAVFECITKGGSDTSQLGKVMTVRVVSIAGKPSQTSFVSTDLPPAAKSCVEKAVGQVEWPASTEGTSETTLRLVLVTRVWVDDPKGACPPR